MNLAHADATHAAAEWPGLAAFVDRLHPQLAAIVDEERKVLANA